MSQPTLWERVKGGSKQTFDKGWKQLDKLGAPVNRLSNKVGAEAFWPTTLDKESDKAARILKTFVKDGFYAEEEVQPAEGPKQKQKVVKKIPTEVIKNAKGLAIFTTMRTGLWVSGAGGSGVLIAKQDDGTWSPPSGIMLHTAGLGFLVGIDIYDCVVVINTKEALEGFTKVRCTLGSEVSVAAGPVGAGGVLETEVHKRQAAIFTYLKSRGFYAGVQIDGTVIIERTDENERFYGERIAVADILAGKVRHPPYEVRGLLETVRAAQGDTDVDESLIPTEAPPSDYVLEDGHMFGIPDKEDPDPYGVLALEKEGMSIKEAGTQKRASWEVFSFNPSPTSPVHEVYSRNSMERRKSASRPNSWRMSGTANEPKSPSNLRVSREIRAPPPLPPRRPTSRMVDSSTQTEGDLEEPSTPTRAMHRRASSSLSLMSGQAEQMQEVPEHKQLDTSPERREVDEKTADDSTQVNGYNTPPRTPPAQDKSPEDHEDSHTEDSHIEEPVVHSVQSVQPTGAAQVISKARLVDVPKRVPPKLPERNPNRSGPVVVDASPKESSNDEAFDDKSKHDSAHDVASENKTDTDDLKLKMDDVRIDDDDEDELRPNPWAKVEETRKKEAEELSPASPIIPGSFAQ